MYTWTKGCLKKFAKIRQDSGFVLFYYYFKMLWFSCCIIVWIPLKSNFNPITYGILRFPQLWGWGLFGPDPENKVMVNRLTRDFVPIMVRMTIVNIQNFQLLAFLLLEILRHKVTALRKGTNHRDSLINPWNRPNFVKNHFLSLKTSFLPLNYTPLAFSSFSSKTKNPHDRNSRRLILKTTAATPPPSPWWMDSPEVLTKCAWYIKTKIMVHSLSSGKAEMFLCAACHAFTPHVNEWKIWIGIVVQV